MKVATALAALAALSMACKSSNGLGAAPELPMDKPERATSDADPLQRIARVDGPTFIEILEVRARDDGMLFYCTGVRGLQVVDARDPSSMRVVAELQSKKYGHKRFGRCQHVAWDGDIVYFTNRGDMIQKTPFIVAYDLSKQPPVEIASYTAEGATFEGIAARGGKLYVAMHDQGLAVFEISGSSLVKVGATTGMKAAWSVALSGDRAIVADATGQLVTIDVSDPRKPERVASVDIGGSAQSVAISGNHAYVAAGASGLVVVDIEANKRVGSAVTNGSALQVTVAGTRAYVANWADARVYDISDPSSPRLIAREVVDNGEPDSRVLGLGARGDTVFAGEWTGMYAYRLHPERKSPDATLSDSRVDFERTAPGASRSQTVDVENEGTAPLSIESATATGDGFAATLETREVPPGGSAEIEVRFSPAGSEAHDGRLVVATNDPDQPTLQIRLAGNHSGLAVGDEAPEVNLRLIDGGNWKLSAQRGKVVVLAYFATF